MDIFLLQYGMENYDGKKVPRSTGYGSFQKVLNTPKFLSLHFFAMLTHNHKGPEELKGDLETAIPTHLLTYP